jgi:beta-mannosidase
MQFLFDSLVETSQNAVRVWGGGNYETDLFYQLADKVGILIWQDAMFASAVYPADPAFLNNVHAEITEQVC